MDPEGGLFDDGARPSPRDELFFGDYLAGALGQRSQYIEGAAADAHRFSVLEERALSGVQPKRSEDEDFFIHRRQDPQPMRRSPNGSGVGSEELPPAIIGSSQRISDLSRPRPLHAFVHRRPPAETPRRFADIALS
jgi:hypothetical protein